MYKLKLCLSLFVIFTACNKIIAEDVEVEEESAFPNISDAVLGFIKKTEEHLQDIYEEVQNRIAERLDEVKATFDKVFQKIDVIMYLAEGIDEKFCVAYSFQDFVDKVLSEYESRVENANSITNAVPESKMKFASIKDTLIKTDLKEAKSKFDECMNQESEKNCRTLLEETLKATKEKAEEEVIKQYVHAKGELYNSLEVFMKWAKNQVNFNVQKTGVMVKRAETCIKLVHEKKDEL